MENELYSIVVWRKLDGLQKNMRWLTSNGVLYLRMLAQNTDWYTRGDLPTNVSNNYCSTVTTNSRSSILHKDAKKEKKCVDIKPKNFTILMEYYQFLTHHYIKRIGEKTFSGIERY